MDKIPSEICTYIFALACSDNGFTGRSLSQVSRYVREASRTVKLQSICLHGHRQILAFAELIEQAHATVRKVRQLFVCNKAFKKSSDKPPPAPKPDEKPSDGTPRSPEDIQKEKRRQSIVAQQKYRERKKQWKIIDQAMAKILVEVGSTIERLAISFGSAGILSHIREPLPLPKLMDLTTTHGSLSWLAPSHRLHRLHIIYKHFADMLRSTSMLTVPALKELRISGIQQWQASLPDELRDALGIQSSSSVTVPNSEKFPDTLQRIFILPPIPPAISGYIGSPLLDHDGMIRDLRLLQSSDQRVVFLEEGDTGFVLDVFVEERLWLEDSV